MEREPEFEPVFTMFYSFESQPGDIISDSAFQQNINIELCITDESNVRLKTVGKAQLKLLLIAAASNHGWDAEILFDSSESLMQLGCKIYDFESGDINQELLYELDFDLFNEDIAILTSLEILPEYRGMGLGKAMVRDICRNYSGSCGLLIVEIFPLQHDEGYYPDKDWHDQMEYNKMEKDFERSELKIKAFYKSLGFKFIESIPEVMFIVPATVIVSE